MLARPSQQAVQERLIQTIEPALLRAYVTCFRRIASNVDRRALIEAVARTDIAEAIALAGVTRAALGPLYAELLQANSLAIQALADHISIVLPVTDSLQVPETRNFVHGNIDQTIDGIVSGSNEVIGSAILYGFEQDMKPETIVTMIIGTVAAGMSINKVNPVRNGGLMGLTPQQFDWIKTARRELKMIPPSEKYLKRTLREKSLDKIVREAIKTGKALSSSKVVQIIGAYAAKIVLEQARRLALREVMKAVNGNRLRLLLKSLEGKDMSLATKEWVTQGDNRVRHSHRAMQGQRINLLDPFVSPSGAQLQYPHDPKAPQSETAGCRCWFRARYRGRFI